MEIILKVTHCTCSKLRVFQLTSYLYAGLQSEKVITRLPYQERLAEKNWNQREIIEFMRLKTWHKKVLPNCINFFIIQFVLIYNSFSFIKFDWVIKCKIGKKDKNTNDLRYQKSVYWPKWANAFEYAITIVKLLRIWE